MESFFSSTPPGAKEGVIQWIVSAIKECKNDATNDANFAALVTKKAECSNLPDQLAKDYPNIKITKDDIITLYDLISKLSDTEREQLVKEHPIQGGGRRAIKSKSRKSKSRKSKSIKSRKTQSRG